MACASGADATTRHAVSGQLACLRAANGCQLWVLTATTFVATFKGPIGPRTHSMAKDLYELVINATSSLIPYYRIFEIFEITNRINEKIQYRRGTSGTSKRYLRCASEKGCSTTAKAWPTSPSWTLSRASPATCFSNAPPQVPFRGTRGTSTVLDLFINTVPYYCSKIRYNTV